MKNKKENNEKKSELNIFTTFLLQDKSVDTRKNHPPNWQYVHLR